METCHLDYVSSDELLACSVAVLNFLLEPEEVFEELKTFETPANISLQRLIEKNHTTMADFTMYMNKQFGIYEMPLWSITAKEFFRKKESSIAFYMHIINKLYVNTYQLRYANLLKQ